MAERGESLTDREREVLELVATGITNREVAQQLFISINTVKVHLRNIYTKLGADSRTEATMIAVREGWVSVGKGEETSAGTSAEEGEAAPETRVPAPPLPWPKRVALLASLVMVVGGIIATWPRAQARPSNGSGFPSGGRQGGVGGSSQDSESPWKERAQMPTRRAHLALAVADGQLLAIGGQTSEGVTAAVEAYDPGADIWTPLREKPTAVAYIGAATIGADVYVPGGCNVEGQPIRAVDVYDVETDAWHQIKPLPEPRCAYALVAQEDALYLFGGWDGQQYVSTTYAYDVGRDEWRELPPSSVARGFAGATSLNGRLYVVGGYDGEKELTDCASYDPTSQTWSACAPLAVGRGGLGLAAVGGRLYAIGGGGWSSYLGFNERYSLEDDSWSAVETPLVGKWRNPGVAVFDGAVYAVGGWSSDFLSLNQAYEALPFRISIPVIQQ